MRKALISLAVLGLAACQPAVPNSAQGVGFGDYATYLKTREAELRGQAPAASSTPPTASTAATAPTSAAIVPPGGGYGTTGFGATPATSAAIAAQGQGSGGTALEAAASAAPQGTLGAEALAALQATAPASAAPVSGGAGAPLSALSEGTLTPSAAAPVSVAPVPGAAVSGATISGAGGPNLAAYALSAPSTYGQPYYRRGGLKLGSSERACRKFISPDLAQTAFLERGGPERDPGNLDPDGDGFACGWDPRPFQTARQ